MRKKFIKSSRPTYKKRIRKGQTGMRFASYNVVETPRVELADITNPINPFSEYNYNTTYDKPEALVVPVRDTNETNIVVDKPTVEPVINKPVASNPVTANSTWKSPYRDRSKWVTDLTSAYKRAGITNDNAIKMLLAQDALESSWGKSAQGKYNFGNLTTGSSWKGDYVTGNDKNAKGEAIKQKFRSYNSMDEYAADKIQFLKRLYDFDENDDINKFVAKLTGSNKGKRRYAEATNYAKVLTGVYNGIPKGQNGLVVNRDAIKDYRPSMPIAPTKQRYMPTQSYVSQDNRSLWEHQQGQAAAEKGYKEYMEAKKMQEGLENLNGFLTFTDYAGLATGLGSLLSKGVSYAGKRLIKKGTAKVLGNEAKQQISNSLVLGSKINNNNPMITMQEALKAQQEGEIAAKRILIDPTVYATSLRNSELAKRLGLEDAYYLIGNKKMHGNSTITAFNRYETFKNPRATLMDMPDSKGAFVPGINKYIPDQLMLSYQVEDYYDAVQTMTHESLHRGMYGNSPVQMLKASKLIDAKRAAKAFPNSPDYLLRQGEAAANTNDVRTAMRLELGQEYPGYEKFKLQFDEFANSNHPDSWIARSYKQDTPRDYKRIWDALTGKWFMYPAIGIGLTNVMY